MLTLNNISKSYPQRGLVLDKLSFEAGKGDTIAIMGPSGSGKTTMMNLIGLLDRPDEGTIIFRGGDILSYSDNESARYRNLNIGFVFQEHLLLAHLTVIENILLPLMATACRKEEFERKEDRIRQLMAKTGIAGLAGKYPSEISGGEAQRVALVRALSNEPPLLLADEPTGSLDSRNAGVLGDLLTLLNAETGITLLLATHSEKLAEKMSRTLYLNDGKLI
jgi:ABC-type lipoprotein export system ATPase subunit